MKFRFVLLVVIVLLSAPIMAQDDDTGVLNIYSARHYGAMEAPFVAFEETTGIEVRVSQGSPRALLERLRAEGDRTPADVFLAIDAGVLSMAAAEGLLQAVESEVLDENIPESMKDPENHWFALSLRVRSAVYNPEAVSEEELDSLNTYSDLADPMWADRVCLRPASHIYTVSLVSGLIYHLGEEEAQEVVAGWVSNNPIYINSDTRNIEAVHAGECDVSLVNHYYLGRQVAQETDAAAVQIKWLNQDTTGTFFNVNGAGITANAENYDNAVAFIEFMSSLEGQSGGPEGFPGSNYEFPANFEAEPNEIIAEFGEFDLDLNYSLWEYGAYQEAAVKMLEDTGYGFDEG